ncbi:MAG: hypothetical protein HQK64_02375 [Desulfamplus sp.]|nr:hypothetical protein [Desulfamplus sp.]MBF0241307.1 hypothetical protein [Desulfamplus sp.]
MRLHKNRPFLIGAALSTILFVSIMVYRVTLYNGTFKQVGNSSNWLLKATKYDESWMNIYQNSKKIGFTHRTIKKLRQGYNINEKSVMKLNTMGLAQKVDIESKSTTDMDFAVQVFDFKIASGSFNLSLNGEIKGNTIIIKNNNSLVSNSSSDKKDSTIEIPLENRPYLTSGIIQATLASGLKQGDEMVLFIFDPSTLGQIPATVKIEAKESVNIDGKEILAQKVSLSFKGLNLFTWLDDDGRVLKEDGLLGLTLIRTDKKGALEGEAM